MLSILLYTGQPLTPDNYSVQNINSAMGKKAYLEKEMIHVSKVEELKQRQGTEKANSMNSPHQLHQLLEGRA